MSYQNVKIKNDDDKNDSVDDDDDDDDGGDKKHLSARLRFGEIWSL